MPNLRSTLNTISGVDVGGHEFTLEDTDVQSYIDNPEKAALEAQVAKARYGGSSINDPSSSDPLQGVQGVQGSGGQGVQDPNMPQPIGVYEGPERGGKRPIDFSRRGDFEHHVFNQLKTENIPDGNPFRFNPTASLNAISKQDLPDLFSQVFQNEVTWQDRHLLDDEQKKYWMSEVKRYRAHVKSALDAEREEAIAGYNQMMNSFDNAAKESEALRRRERQRRQDITTAQDKARVRKEKFETANRAYLRLKSQLLSTERQRIQEYMDADATGAMTPEEKDARLAEIKSIREERKALTAEHKSRQVPKPKSAVTKVKGSGKATEPEPEKDKSGKTIVRKKIPSQKGGKTVVRTAIHKGNKVLIYSDGSKAYADETE